MAISAKHVESQMRLSDVMGRITLRAESFLRKPSVILMPIFMALLFFSALYYVEQQVRLQKLNYRIIELKKQKKVLQEQQKTYALQLHQLKRLDRIEREIQQRGFVPVEKEQLRIVQ